MQSEFSSYVWFPSASASSCTNCFVSCLLCSSSSNTNGLGCPSMSCKGRGIVQSCTDMTCSIDYTGVSYCLITILLSSNSFSSSMLDLTGLINLMKSTIPGLVGCCCCCVAQLRRSLTLPAGLAGKWAVNTCSRAFSLIKICTMEQQFLLMSKYLAQGIGVPTSACCCWLNASVREVCVCIHLWNTPSSTSPERIWANRVMWGSWANRELASPKLYPSSTARASSPSLRERR